MKGSITPTQAARLLGIGGSSVRRWIDSGELPARRTPGGHRRIASIDLEKFASSHGMALQADPHRMARRDSAPPLVLVVDDDEALLRSLKKTFETELKEFRFHFTSDGFEAGMIAMRERPFLLLVDFRMPGVDGITVCRTVRRLLGGAEVCRIAAITSYSDDQNLRAEFWAAGGDHIQTKPLNLNEIVAFVRATAVKLSVSKIANSMVV
ncbi:MAG: response regulator [Candidatus Hydrogenedentota bacterium]